MIDDDDEAAWRNNKLLARRKIPIVYAENAVQVRGDALTEPTYWVGRQWAVTGFGIECRDGTYPIEKDRLWEDEPSHGWAYHMSEKNWIDMPDFMTALFVARGIFGKEPG